MLRDAALHIFCYAFMTTIRTLSRSVGDMEAVWAAPQPLAALGAALLRKLGCASKDIATVFQLDRIVGIRIDRIVGVRIVSAFRSSRSADGNGLDTEKKKSFFLFGRDQRPAPEPLEARILRFKNQHTGKPATEDINGIHRQSERRHPPAATQGKALSGCTNG